MMMKRNFILLSLTVFLGACTGSLVDPSLEELVEAPPIEEAPLDPGLAEEEIIPLGLSLLTFRGGEAIQGGTQNKITWYIKTDPSYTEMDPGFYLSKVELSKDNGMTWEIPAGGDQIPGVSDAEISYAWNTPLEAGWEGDGFQVRVTVTNTAGNKHKVNSSSFVIDNDPPVIVPNTLKLNESTSSPYSAKTSSVGISFEATDELSAVSFVCFRLNSTTQPLANDGCWKPFNILGLTPAKNLKIKGLSQFLGFVGGSFTLYFWVKDKAGNASSLTSSVGDLSIDSRVISYSPGNSVSFSKFVAGNTDLIERLPTLNETVLNSANTTLVLKWAFTVAPGAALASSSPITLEYTDDIQDYLPLPTPPLINGINGSCTLTDSATGCLAMTAPTALIERYSRLRLRVKDDGNFVYTLTSNALNTGKFRTLAGNTDSGIGGSASQAVFSIAGGASTERTDTGSLVVAEDGSVFVKDVNRGILLVNPKDGSLSVFVPRGSTSVDGPLANAKTAGPLKIALDYQNNLLIMERDRIRRATRTEVDGVVSYTVSTIIGTGTLTNRDASGIAALSFRMATTTSYFDLFMTPLPNGDIYFSQTGMGTASGSVDVRVFKAAKNKVYPLILSGKGVFGEPYRTISDLISYSSPGISFSPVTSIVESLYMRWCKQIPGDCLFFASNLNPRTGISNGTGTHFPSAQRWGNHSYVTSRRGELYVISARENAGLSKINTSAKTWGRILGNGFLGQCADSTLSNACALDLTDAYINSENIVFFLDRNQVRAVGSDNRVATIFGQSKSKGDDGDPLLARFNRIDHLSTWGDSDNVIVMDVNESVMREFRPGATISSLAGNRGFRPFHAWNSDRSSQLTALNSTFTGLYESRSAGFVVDKATGEPVSYTHNGNANNVSKLIRGAADSMRGKWYRLVGGGSKQLTNTGTASCDGTTNNCVIDGYPPAVMGWIPPLTIDAVNVPGQALVSSYNVYNSNIFNRCFIKAVQVTDGLVQHFLGNNQDCGGSNGSSINFPADGVVMANSSSMPMRPNDMSRFIYYQRDDSVLMVRFGTKRIVKVPIVRNAATKVITGGGSISTFIETDTAVSSFNVVTDLQGYEQLVYCDIDGILKKQNVSTRATAVLPFPSTTIKCMGRSLEVSADGRKVIFPYTVNGIYAVGEYLVVE